LYNVLLCQEIARGYTRKNISPICMMKVDLKKAYEYVDWEAMKEVLISLRFPSIFIKWLMACITTPTYTIHMNGEEFGYFEGGRGLRQGHPLSPLLFVLVIEYLSRLYLHAGNNEGFKFHPYCKDNKMTHLIFTDDLIVFSAGVRNIIISQGGI